MTATLTTKQIRDAAGNIFQQRVVDTSGTGDGPFLPLHGLSDPDGTGPLDVEALVASLVTAVSAGAVGAASAAKQDVLAAKIGEVQPVPTANTVLDRLKAIATGLGGVVLGAGAAVIGKVGLQVGGADVASANPMPIRNSGPAYQPSGLASLANAAVAGANAAFAALAGRQAYLTLSGGTSLAGAVQWSLDGGASWSAITVEGTQIGVIAYAGTPIIVPLPICQQAGMQMRLMVSALAGAVSYRFSQ